MTVAALEPFAGLVASVDALDADQLLERLRSLEDERRRSEAESAVLLAELERRRSHRIDGHASMWGLLRAVVGWSDRECRERMRIARVVDRFRDLGEMFLDGRMPVAHVAEIGRGFANPRCGDQIDDVIGTLSNEATRLEFDDFKLVVRRWELLADTDGAHRDAQTDHASRTAHCVVWDGVGHLDAQWGQADGLANREIFDRFVETEWRADWDATVAAHGDQASALLMPRSAAQRRADALTAIFQAAAAAAPGARRPEPVLSVFVDHQTFIDLLAEAELLPERRIDPFEAAQPLVTERRCQTEHGDPVDPLTALQISIEGLVRFVVLDDEGVPIRWGRTRRFFTGATRDAVMAQSPRCTHPGCRVPARRCDADHITRWTDRGQTEPTNGNPKCRRHNLLGNHGYRTTRDRHGRWHTHRPDGTTIR